MTDHGRQDALILPGAGPGGLMTPLGRYLIPLLFMLGPRIHQNPQLLSNKWCCCTSHSPHSPHLSCSNFWLAQRNTNRGTFF
jgi:hypothetical protein